MKRSLAILMSGEIRLNSSDQLKIIKNILSQFGIVKNNFNCVDLYFQTWTKTDENLLKDMSDSNLIHKLIIDTEPDKLPEDYFIFNNGKVHNIYCMFTGVYNCFKSLDLDKNYDYICRCRNDLNISFDARIWFRELYKNENAYICPPLFWMGNDGINDHFCICSKAVFEKIWGLWNFDNLKFMFTQIHTTPETTIYTQAVYNYIDVIEILPKVFNYYLTDGKINYDLVNGYMFPYIYSYMILFQDNAGIYYKHIANK